MKITALDNEMYKLAVYMRNNNNQSLIGALMQRFSTEAIDEAIKIKLISYVDESVVELKEEK